MKNPEPRLKITSDGTPQGTTIHYDGKPLDGVEALTFTLESGQVSTVTLRCWHVGLELDAATNERVFDVA